MVMVIVEKIPGTEKFRIREVNGKPIVGVGEGDGVRRNEFNSIEDVLFRGFGNNLKPDIESEMRITLR